MKSIRSLLMIAICTVAFTSTAETTAKMEQKQKAELVMDVTIQSNAVSVVNEYQDVTVLIVTQFEKASDLKVFTFVTEPLTSLAIADDVGWQSSSLFTVLNFKNYAIINDRNLQNFNKQYKQLATNEYRMSSRDFYHLSKNKLYSNRIRDVNHFKTDSCLFTIPRT